FAPDADQVQMPRLLDRLIFFRNRLLGQLDGVGVEGPGQPTVAGDDDEQRAVDFFAALEQDMRARIEAVLQVAHDLAELEGVGARLEDALLGTAQLGRRHHLHGPRHLLRVLYRPDAVTYVAKAWHVEERG